MNQSHLRFSTIAISFCLVNFLAAASGQAVADEISFNRDIRPILTNHCFACHGPDAKATAADLRLDLRNVATQHAIVPGNSDDSDVMARILSQDEDVVMPPPELHKPLKKQQIELIRKWIDIGAPYQEHWSYTPLQRPSVPAAQTTAAQTTAAQPTGAEGNPIDRFIGAKLAGSAIQTADAADRITLIRRLSFDLTGLPPTPNEVDQFVSDFSPKATEKLIDRLLDSPRYGERMAIYWLDLVRYADTVGYHGDQNVSVSPYRDYVISAFNSNMSYKQFVREQLAGDLLPNPTQDQLVATGYNRLNQTTEEGGAQPKEYLAIYFADRVRNVSQVFMGATVGCAQCHDHKYDPYTAKDFYSLGAFFADIDERGKYGGRERKPEMAVPTEQEQAAMAELRKQISHHEEALSATSQKVLQEQTVWEQQALSQVEQTKVVEHVWVDDKLDVGGTKSGSWTFSSAPTTPVHSGTASRPQTSPGLIQHYFIGAKEKVTVSDNTEFYTWVYLDPANPPKAMMLQFNAGDDRGGWSHRAVWGDDSISYGRQPKSHAGYQRMGQLPATAEWVRLAVDATNVGLKSGDKVNGVAFTQFGGTVYWDQLGWIDSSGMPAAVVEALKTASDERTADQKQLLTDACLNSSEAIQSQKATIAQLQARLKQTESQVTTTLITKSVAPRTIRILPRGNWMDESGDVVLPAIPEFLGELKTESRATRLDFANWLCEDDNVLSSRTMVNRLWYLMFGRGICSSVDDLGGQGVYPTHPELLDFLAVEFVESGWDIKHILKLIASSQAYQRSSLGSAEAMTSDPYNELFARQGRFRISAEMVRDTSLLASGLLVEELGGRSVRPYQPVGYYAQLNFPRRTYSPDAGKLQYRRGVYTHWQRTFLHPMLKAFDAPSREECTAQRAQSNTPLQALTLLNDPTFLEAARAFAVRAIREGGTSMNERVTFLYRTAVSRQPDDFVLRELQAIYQTQYSYFADAPSKADELLSVGTAPLPKDISKAELAAYASVARVILNLRETTTRY